jgi:hypothetical protein
MIIAKELKLFRMWKYAWQIVCVYGLKFLWCGSLNLSTKSTEQSLICISVIQWVKKLPNLWNLKVYYHVHNSMPLDSKAPEWIYTLHSVSLRSHFNIILTIFDTQLWTISATNKVKNLSLEVGAEPFPTCQEHNLRQWS